MLKIIPFCITYTLLLLGACSGPSTPNAATNPHNESGLTLDDGKRWTANSATTIGVQNMLRMIETFETTSSISSCHELSIALSFEYQLIFENCTMKGEAHQQLHLFLMPIGDLLKQLKSNDLTACQEARTVLLAHLNTYSTYFTS